MGYSKQWIKKISELLQKVPLTILKFLFIKIILFLFFMYLPNINKFFSSSFSSSSPAIRMPKWVHVWPQRDNEVPTWFS